MAYARLDIVNDKMSRHFRLGADDLENGAFVKITKLKGSNQDRDTYEVSKLTDGKGDEYGFIHHDGHRYDERDLGGDITVKAGELTRGYLFSKGDVITIDKKHIDGVVVAGDLLSPKAASYQLKKTDSATSVNIVAVVDTLEYFAGKECYVIRFL
ncbi:hypothetical protein JY742_10035 [Clostridioides difficile]|nr:hypothetical protein [Clostridioides difficile]